MHVKRHFVTLGSRQIHYRRAGTGPTVILLHQSPRSSLEYVPWMTQLAAKFTLIAPDTPGNGLSDPLALEHPTIYDYADNLAEFMTALGLDRAAFYGFHTGASIALAFAHRYPERTSVAVANGLVVATPEERADRLAHYLPPFAPQWDGGHLVWAWNRMREQTIFSPWYRPSAAGRMQIDVPSPEALTGAVLELLRAGDHYRAPYASVFAFAPEAAVREMQAPLYVIAAETDSLLKHQARLGDAAQTVQFDQRPTKEATLARAAEILAGHPAPPAPPAPKPRPLTGRTWNDFVDVPGGQLRLKRTDEGAGRPVMVQHDAASSSVIVNPVTSSFIGLRPAFALDLPGNGESDNMIGTEESRVDVGTYADVVAAAIEALGIEDLDLYGMWGGGLVCMEVSFRKPAAVKHLVYSDVLYHTAAEKALLLERYAPPIEPNVYGGHLLQCWHIMRNQGLFWPWFNATKAGIIPGPPYIDDRMVHNRVVEMLKAGNMYRIAYHSHFRYDTHGQLQKLKVPTLLCAPSWDPNVPHTLAAHAAAPHCEYMVLPDDMGAWGRAMLSFLNR
jgi:pimeloyl-ACP methyl ester carboxylesterase